jgi:glycosyltransferase involved in cell wall biosynthesis
MRVVMLVGRSTGGIGTHAVDLTAHLRGAGDEVVVVTDRLTAERFGIADARPWWPSGGPLTAARDLRRLRALAATADVVHAHGHQAGALAVLVTAGTGVPVVVSQHNAVLATGLARRVASRLLQATVARRAALTTGASSDLVEEARRHGARDARVAPVPSPRVPGLLAAPALGVEERRSAQQALLATVGVTGTGPLVLTVSRIAPQKALDVLLDAAERLRTPVTWVVVGDGDVTLRASLREEVARRSLPVHLVGAVPDPGPWLAAADVFVLTSLWEARALVVQEAMAAGTPVVATDTGGLHDLVADAGVLVPVRDAAALAGAVERVLTDSELRGRLSARGREAAASWDDGVTSASRWREWYASLPRMT